MDYNLNKVQQDSIIPNEPGILEKRGFVFHLCSEFARKHLIHILWAGDYLCSPEYCVDRAYLDSHVIMYIKSGDLQICYDGRNYNASTGDVVFMDLRKEHRYNAVSDLEVLQYMVNGGVTDAYFRHLYRLNGAVFRGNAKISFLFTALQSEMMSDLPDDHVVALLVTELFCRLARRSSVEVSEPTKLAMSFMDTHYQDPLSLNDVARHVSLSKFYFTRLFRKETTFTPKEYLNRIRLRHAMHQLSSTTDSVETIALRCGFSSSTVFIRAFKKETDGITPERFRQYFFGIPMGMTHSE